MNDLVVRRIGRLRTHHHPGTLTDAALVVRGGAVDWLGADNALPSAYAGLPELDVAGACVVPGFVDAHTHPVWAGSRREEFVARLAGEHYDGSGIGTTVSATSLADDDALVELVSRRFAAMLANGTTTVEAKTGYGLDPDQELRQLDVLLRVAAETPMTVEPTYLAHVVPRLVERHDHVAATAAALPAAAAAGARWVDVFCDRGAFSADEARTLLAAGRQAGLGLRMHADQLVNTHAARLAAELGCASADHLEQVDAAGAAALAHAGVVAVLLPTATLSTGARTWTPARGLADAGVPLALGTDCNPGTSWCESMPYVIQLACLVLGLNVDEAFYAATRGSARSLRRPDIGHLDVGARGDLAVLAAEHEADVVAHLGAPAVAATVVGGAVVAGVGVGAGVVAGTVAG